ncbi:hypothetical protein FQN57_003186 [Myotisia sp. PD_48]|nr:hypothetical protein FQN57_003186 [Myotisia sp. PD_48]
MGDPKGGRTADPQRLTGSKWRREKRKKGFEAEKAKAAAANGQASNDTAEATPEPSDPPNGANTPLIIDGNSATPIGKDGYEGMNTLAKVAMEQASSEPPQKVDSCVLPSSPASGFKHNDAMPTSSPQIPLSTVNDENRIEPVQECESTTIEAHGILFGHQPDAIKVNLPATPCPPHFVADSHPQWQPRLHHNYQGFPPEPFVPQNEQPFYHPGTFMPLQRFYPPYQSFGDPRANINLNPGAYLPYPSFNNPQHKVNGLNTYQNEVHASSYRSCSSCAENLLAQAAPSARASTNSKADDQHPQELHDILNNYTDPNPTLSHILKLFKTGEYSDSQLNVVSAVGHFIPRSYSIHRLLASRSQHLEALMNTIEDQRCKTIHIVAAETFMHPDALEKALESIYGAPLIDLAQFENWLSVGPNPNEQPHQQTPPKFMKISQLNFSLCYATSGAFLSSRAIMDHGLSLVCTAICWDSLEMALYFGLYPKKFLLACSDATSQVCDSALHRTFATEGASKVMDAALAFIVDNIPPDFALDKFAHPSTMPCRCMNVQSKNETTVHVPCIQFGGPSSLASYSSIDPSSNPDDNTILSAVLLSLPFLHLRQLLSLMEAAGSISQQIVVEIMAERENRRFRNLRILALTGRLHSGPISKYEDALGWEEYAVSDALFIDRTWRGVFSQITEPDTPHFRRTTSF